MLKTMIATHLAVALIAGGVGWKVRDADYQRHLKADAKAQVKAEQGTRKVEAKQETISTDTREEKATKDEQVRVVYQTVTKEVPVYVTQTKFEDRVVAGGGLPAGFVWAYNQSAANSPLPLPPGLDPDSPSGVSMSELALVSAGNFSLCQQWRAEVESWHDWYNKQAAASQQTKE